MFTTNNEDKLDIHSSKEELLNVIKFNDNEERDRLIKYLDLKGVTYHVRIVNHIGLDNEGKVEYKVLRDVYKYDKKIRNILYKFISAFEERLRAFYANEYIMDNSVKDIEEFNDIAEYLESRTFNELLKLIKKLDDDRLDKLFPKRDKHLNKNLDAVRDLRNTISHHKLLLTKNDYKECYINKDKHSDLKGNINNLINLIDDYYKEYIIKEINEAIKSKEGIEYNLPKGDIIKI